MIKHFSFSKIKKISFLTLLAFAFVVPTNAQTQPAIELQSGNIVLNFANVTGSTSGDYTIKRAKGRFGNFQTIGTTANNSFTDANVVGNPYDYYYKIFDSQGNQLALSALDIELFGPNMYIYSPEDNKSSIGSEINGIHTAMQYDQFSAKRYAFYFKPGNYTAAGTLSVAYYTHLGGLDSIPYSVQISNINTPPPLPNNNATCTFWRSAENLAVMGVSASNDITSWFRWGVSQAAPLRRVYSQRRAYYSWWYEGWCSGGFTGDCYFNDCAGSYSQQQWYFRNSFVNLDPSAGGYSLGGWNMCYQGMEFGPTVNMAHVSDNWATSGGAWNNVSRVDKTPIIREKPFLFIGADGRYKVFRPALRYDSKGISYSTTSMGAGTIYDLLDDFYVVKPGTSAQTMNAQLEAGKNLFITPGMYQLSEPLMVNNANTIILGTGYATLIPAASNPTAAIVVADVPGVTIASLLFDAQFSSQRLLQVGQQGDMGNHSDNPTLLADLFFRVGGFSSANVNVDVALEINSSDVIGDHFWIWRADHGSGVGWFKNTAKNGLVVNGHFVTIYGLFNEHFQEYGTLWNGEMGRLYFYQNETPYDVLNQSDYMSHNGTLEGYAAYKIDDNVKFHEAYMLGMYDVFINTNGAQIAVANSMEVPNSTGVKVHNACDVRISSDNMGGFKSVINGQVPSTFYVNGAGKRFYIIDYTGTVVPDGPFIRPVPTNIEQQNVKKNEIFVYPNPVKDELRIVGDVPFDNLPFTIYNISGKKIVNGQWLNGKSINVSYLASGIYFLKITTDSGVVTRKFVKE